MLFEDYGVHSWCMRLGTLNIWPCVWSSRHKIDMLYEDYGVHSWCMRLGTLNIWPCVWSSRHKIDMLYEDYGVHSWCMRLGTLNTLPCMWSMHEGLLHSCWMGQVVVHTWVVIRMHNEGTDFLGLFQVSILPVPFCIYIFQTFISTAQVL